MNPLDKIIKSCISGDRTAQNQLYEIFAPRMYPVCLRYSKDAFEAEDILQEGFIRIFTKIEQYEFKGSFEGWIRRIMINTALENFRRSDKQLTIVELKPYENSEMIEETLSNIAAEDLIHMIQELPPKYRMVFNLYAIEGFSHTEIGEMMGINEGTSKSNLSRARAILQKRVNEIYKFQKKIEITA